MEKAIEELHIDASALGERHQWHTSSKLMIQKAGSHPAVLYSPSEGQYYIVDADHTQVLIDAVREAKAMVEKIHEVQAREVRDTGNQKEYDEAVRKNDDEVQEAADKMVSYFNGVETTPSFRELVVMIRNPTLVNEKIRGFVYIRSDKMMDHWRKLKWGPLKKELDEKLPKSSKKELRDYVDVRFNAPLWTKDWDGQAVPEWRFVTPKEFLKDNEYIDAGAEVAFLRYAAGCSCGTSFDFDEKDLKVEVAGEASFALAQGKATGELWLPSKKGFDLLGVLSSEKTKGAIKEGRTCHIAVHITLEGWGFAGATVRASFPHLNLNAKKDHAIATLGVDAFAGARVGGGLEVAFEWKEEMGKAWEEIAGAGGEVTGSAGIGAEASFQFKYQSGKVYFRVKAGVVVGLGGSADLLFALDAKEGFEMIVYLLDSVDYHRVAEITEETFDKMAAYKLALLTHPDPRSLTFEETLTRGASILSEGLKGWLQGLTRRLRGLPPDELRETKGFIRANLEKYFKSCPPETIGRALKIIMMTKEEKDYPHIINVLSLADSDHELRWILRNVSDKLQEIADAATEEQRDTAKTETVNDGIKKLLEFGNYTTDYEEEGYIKAVFSVLREKGVTYAPMP